MRERLTENHEGIDYRINLVALPPLLGFPHSSVRKESTCSAGDPGLIPGSANSAGEGHGNPLQYSCLDNPTDRGAWRATVHEVASVTHDLVTNLPPPI